VITAPPFGYASRLPLRELAYPWLLACGLWIVHAVWLTLDTRPPVWDMALHQSYALNYLPGSMGVGDAGPLWSRTGNYPPFVHLMIAAWYWIFHPAPRVAVLANLPATLLLFSSVYALGHAWNGRGAGRWACLLTCLTPYLIWMSRETILDYWMSAWVAAALYLLVRTRGFRERRPSLLLGLCLAAGMLTKWLFVGFVFFPLILVSVREMVWKNRLQMVNLIDAGLISGALAGAWYLPNLTRLVHYFRENTGIGALEGEPPVWSFQSWIYYLRLLEGYQFFAFLFAFVCLSVLMVWRKRLIPSAGVLTAAIVGGWIVMTLLRTKDPRFTMPLLGLLCIPAGTWIDSWGRRNGITFAKAVILALLMLQAYAVNFGFESLPKAVILARGYQGTLRWDWNLYLQEYFGILGSPRRENWQQEDILKRMSADASGRGALHGLALIPDLPRFNAANFSLYARLSGIPLRVDHPQRVQEGIRSFDGFDYVLMTEGDQGISWTTHASLALNRIVVDDPEVFRLVEIFPLPNGDSVRLYFIRRSEAEPG